MKIWVMSLLNTSNVFSSFQLLCFFGAQGNLSWRQTFEMETTIKPVMITNNVKQEGQFSLIHIPLPLYSSLLQPILRVLLPHGGPTHSEPEGPIEGITADNKHSFLNISVTPIECSVVCHSSWAKNIFEPVIKALPEEFRGQVSVSKDAYNVFSVSSAGMEAGQRVMDLTAPLAMAGIPIFFITTYYTDFILVPAKDRHTVGQALLARGFEFSENESAYIAPTMSHSRGTSIASDPPSTPPPSNVAELQIRTFSQLRKRNVVPFVEKGLHLVQCAGKELLHEDEYSRPKSNGNGSYQQPCPVSWLDNIDPKLYVGLVSALAQRPRFLSVTLTEEDAPSLLVDKSLLWLFGNSIAGDTDAILVPIFLDLVDLPLESTGIVCGVAGKLVDKMRVGEASAHAAELSYLSTARAGAVILSPEGSAMALQALRPLLKDADGSGTQGASSS